MALEKFYKEYMFPSDEMKAKTAVQVGLTEKQISSWFCHRRLKDKKRDEYANGRLDHSSGVIQDRGSGLRQESSESMKEREYRNIDLREVESGRISSADHVYDRRRHQNPYDAHMEDTSSESSSSLQDMRFSESRDPYNMPNSAKLRQNGAIFPVISSTTKNKVYKPSGYLKVKGEIEFDPLPNGAFEFPSSKSISDMDTSSPAAFVNGGLLRMHVGRKVRAVVKVTRSDVGSVMGMSTDGSQIVVKGSPLVPLTSFVEVIGYAENDNSIRAEIWTNFGDSFDAANYDELCKLANGELKHLFL